MSADVPIKIVSAASILLFRVGDSSLRTEQLSLVLLLKSCLCKFLHLTILVLHHVVVIARLNIRLMVRS